jgi:hypothetical protein
MYSNNKFSPFAVLAQSEKFKKFIKTVITYHPKRSDRGSAVILVANEEAIACL